MYIYARKKDNPILNKLINLKFKKTHINIKVALLFISGN